MEQPTSVQARICVDEIAGYLFADHEVRKQPVGKRAPLARTLLKKLACDPRCGYDRGFSRRLNEFIQDEDSDHQRR
ncbi:hypothetical protein GII33_22725 (plasmid) [Gordonia pseudamarae]|jgi:hypothetical protein|uniref:hypothetical protein n=1 Tax=Gordonia pseudamarae TaxID=2831662 RepID=UPI001AF55BDF|nr:hypothetical protein [Gordonia pseudamarae]QHN28910.1 hypothetical protein GII33_22725 [Gordonia pseudamarae]HMT33646.1 hypothetical protein [Dermatophilaceae bacterium]